MSNQARPLKPEELDFIAALLRTSEGGDVLVSRLSECLVSEMNDGGMGSLRFVSSDGGERKIGRVLTEAWFEDRDGVLVSVAVNLDDHGDLFELDIWKTDFSPLISLPTESEIRSEWQPEQLKFVSEEAAGRRFLIEHDTAAGFYLYVFEGDRCTHDYLQDTFAMAVRHASEEFGVPEESWKKVSG